MKKEYQKPMAEVIEFVPEDDIMDVDAGDDDWFGEDGEASGSVEDW